MVVIARQRRTASFLSRWGAVTAALCVVHFALALTISGAPLRMTVGGPAIEWALLCRECIAIGILAVLPSLPGHWTARAAASLVTVTIVAAGWITFIATGRFPGFDGMRFLFTVPEQSFEHLLHLRPALLLASPVIIVLGTTAITLLAVAAGRDSATRHAKVLLLMSSMLIASSMVGHAIANTTLASDSDEIYDTQSGASYRTDLFWRAVRGTRSGPISVLLRSAVTELSRAKPTPADPRIPVTYPARNAGLVAVAGAPAHRWNVLIIEVESMRADVLRGWGNPRDVMPVVDSIASEGRRFLDTYTTATQTNLAAAVPLSGIYPLRWPGPRAYAVRTPFPKLLLYDLLQPLGWRAAVFSSQNESWWGMVNFLRSGSLDTLFNAENYRGHTSVPGQDLAFAEFVTRARRSGKIDDHDTMLEAMRWLARDQHRPFMLYLNMQSSHIPYTVPSGAPHPFGAAPSFPVMFGRYPKDSVEVVRSQYFNALHYIDQQIGMLRLQLIADGRWDSTIVVITGDHGQAFYEHDVAAHANGLWEEQVHVPLVVRAPHLPASNDSRPASHIDIPPTIADLLGLPDQPAWQGESLVSPTRSDARARFFMVQSPLADESAVVVGNWKLVRDNLSGVTRLTDLQDDPGEHRDATAQHPETAGELDALVSTWRRVQLEYYASDVAPATKYPPRVGQRNLDLARR